MALFLLTATMAMIMIVCPICVCLVAMFGKSNPLVNSFELNDNDKLKLIGHSDSNWRGNLSVRFVADQIQVRECHT